MKKVLIYATCQGVMLYGALGQSEQFLESYSLDSNIHNYELIRTDRKFLEYNNQAQELKEADLFIYQPLDDSYGHNATNHLLSYLKPDAIAISIPYVVNLSLWPLIIGGAADIGDDFHLAHLPTIKNHEVIDALVDQGLSVDDILDLYDRDQIDYKYQARHKATMQILKDKESITDITVSDFIEKNIEKIKLFNYPSHPTYPVIFHMANQILQRLGLDPIKCPKDTSDFWMPVNYLPYADTAQQVFKFKFDTDAESKQYYRNIIVTYLTTTNTFYI
jgi:hypothetical protein